MVVVVVVVVVVMVATATVAMMVVVAVPAPPPPRRGLTNVEPPFEIHPSESETRVADRGVAARASR